MIPRITADNITKRYDSSTAVAGLSMEILGGECVGIFGRSGSGKSTLLRLLAGLEIPDEGSISATGRRSVARFGGFGIAEDLRVGEFLTLCAQSAGVPPERQRGRVREVIGMTGLEGDWSARIGALPSGKMKLVFIAAAILPPFDVLLLDEPMAGLDHVLRRRLWAELLAMRAREGCSIVIATSAPDDAELCDRVLLLNKGCALAMGGVEELRDLAGEKTIALKPLTQGMGGHSTSSIEVRDEDGGLTVRLKSGFVERAQKGDGEISAIRFLTKRIDAVLDELSSRPDTQEKDL